MPLDRDARQKTMKVCIIRASGKLGKYMVQQTLDRGYEVVGVCRERSVSKLDAFKDRIAIIPGATNDRAVIQRAVHGCDGVLTVLVPWALALSGRAPDWCGALPLQDHVVAKDPRHSQVGLSRPLHAATLCD